MTAASHLPIDGAQQLFLKQAIFHLLTDTRGNEFSADRISHVILHHTLFDKSC